MTHTYTIRLAGTDTAIACPESVSVLNGFLNQDVQLVHGCKNGRCKSCKATLLEGRIQNEDGETIDSGEFLSCSYIPLSDLVIEADYCPELADIQRRTLPCKVNQATYVGDDILILTLRTPPNQRLVYLPGQYLDLTYQGVCRSYSIANSPNADGTIELHIKRYSGGEMSALFFDKPITTNTLMSMRAPLGTFFVRDGEAPLVFLATGTGLAPIKAMIESLIHEGDKRPITLLWGCREEADFYDKRPTVWASQYDHIKVEQVLSKRQRTTAKKHYVQDHLLTIHPDLSGFDVYACGSLTMIEDAESLLCEYGLDKRRFFYDAFVASHEKD